MELVGKKILLRDMVSSDIPDHVYWETVDNEWQLWDGPWHYEGKTEAELASERQTQETRWHARAGIPPAERPSPRSLEICLNSPEQTHIGWCGVYQMDEDFCIAENGKYYAMGLTIPSRTMRGQGYAAEAMRLYIHWLKGLGISDVYTQTWSGNTAMLALAERLGFGVCRRKKDLRLVRGQRYDGLTFRLINDL